MASSYNGTARHAHPGTFIPTSGSMYSSECATSCSRLRCPPSMQMTARGVSLTGPMLSMSQGDSDPWPQIASYSGPVTPTRPVPWMANCQDHGLSVPPGQCRPAVRRQQFPERSADCWPEAVGRRAYEVGCTDLQEWAAKYEEMMHAPAPEPDHQAVAYHAPSPDMVPRTKFHKGSNRVAEGQRQLPVHSNLSSAHANSRDGLRSPSPHCTEAQSGTASDNRSQPQTTLFISNIPTRYTRQEFMEEVCSLGCRNEFDFLHLTPGKNQMINRGFAFMNCVNVHAARRCFSILSGHVWQRHQAAEVKEAVVRQAVIQGLEGNLRARSEAVAREQTKRLAMQHRNQHATSV